MPENVQPIAALLAPLARTLRHKGLNAALEDMRIGKLTRALIRLQALPFNHGVIRDACRMLVRAGA